MSQVVIFKSESEYGDDYKIALEKRGYKVKFIPVLDFGFKNLEQLGQCLLKPDDYMGIIFTSPRSVSAAKAASGAGGISPEWKSKKNFCVGESTHRMILEDLDIDSDGKLTGNASSLSTLILETVKERGDDAKPFLFPCGNLKTDTLPTRLIDNGLKLEAIEVYETVAHVDLGENLDLVINDPTVEYLVFFSPSGFNFCCDILTAKKYDLSKVKLIAIGPSTRKAIEAREFVVHKTAEKPNAEYLALALFS